MSLEGMRLDRYQIGKQIGNGGMSQVYRATDLYLSTNREVAIKVITADNPSQAELISHSFEREVKAIGKLNHPHILPLFDYNILPMLGTKFSYMVMPLCHEGSLADWKKERILSLQDVAHFLRQAAAALQHAHEQRIFHKDVKPQNFLMRNNVSNPQLPDLLLTDFGIAKLSTATISWGNLVAGTPAYMPPEQWDGNPLAATDQYALAVMAYQLLTSRFPFQSYNQKEMQDLDWMKRQHLMTKPEPPSKHNPTIPEPIDPVILRALAKNSAERYPSISQFADAFKQAVQSTEKGADIHMILAISEAEALVGCSYPLTLPKGHQGQQVTVTVPKGAKAGLEIPLEGKGKRPEHGQPGNLIVTIAVKPAVDKDQLLIRHLERISTDTSILISRPTSDQTITKQLADLNTRIDKVQSHSTGSYKVIRNRLSTGLTILLVALAMIIVGSSVGLFYFMNQMITTNATTTNDAISLMATTFAHAIGPISKTPVATQTPVANLNTYAPSQSTLVLYDPLLSNKNWNRDLHTQDQSTCEFKAGTFQVMQNSKDFIHNCPYLGTNFHNFTFEVQMKIISGSGGIFFDADQYNINFYYFYISNGNYGFDIYSSGNGHYRNLRLGSYQNISKSVKIAVVANNSSFDLYANNQFLTSVSDNTFPGGQIGVAAGRGNSLVQFNEARVWIL